MKTKSKSNDTKQIIADILDLYRGLLIPYMQVQRDLPFPGDSSRFETDGEHAFMLAVAAITVAQKLDLKLDYGKLAQYAIVHDLVEAHAGDVSARQHSDEIQAQKVVKEKEAMLVIQKQYADKAPWIPEMIERYETKADDEAKFVYALDKQMGAFTWLSGDMTKWKESYPEPDGELYHAVVKLLRKKASIYPPLLDLFDAVHTKLDNERPK